MRRFFLAFLLACVAPFAAAQEIDPAQRARIDDAVSRFPAATDENPRVFFLGFAGFGAERVFAEEIKLAAANVGARFGSTPRTLLLINDRRDHETFPIATHTTLGYAVASLSHVMDPGRDVLFLVLSSHGSSNGMIEVSDEGMEPTGLSPKFLKSLLDMSGIRQRVIVVSSCFSGAFVKPLANNDTILITAARRDRTSFGCSDQRHLTYFGEAFFRDALPVSPDLRTAFDLTRKAIAEREKEEKVTPSQPQSHFGPRMESALAAFSATAY